MRYKSAIHTIVFFCIISGAALMAYADFKKRSITEKPAVEAVESSRDHKACKDIS